VRPDFGRQEVISVDGLDSAGKPDAPASRPVVLLADDEPLVLMIAQHLLEDSGFSVLPAEDGCQAVSIFEAKADSIACVILDASMPNMNGEEAARRIKAIRSNARILMASGTAGSELHQRMGGLMDCHVQKPFRIEDLCAKIRAAIAGT
jgi:CheY-like chemotaxis protein